MITPFYNLSVKHDGFGDAVDHCLVTRAQLAEIVGRYHNTNRVIQTDDTRTSAAEDARLMQLQKTRLALKQAITAALRDR